MDARPQRGRVIAQALDAENVPISRQQQEMHQRHKSASNLKSVDTASSGVLKLAAKRTVFGDVSNTSRLPLHHAAADVRTVVPLAISKKSSVPQGKEHFNRPAQRPPAQRSAAVSSFQHSNTTQSIRMVASSATINNTLGNQPMIKEIHPKRATLVYRDNTKPGLFEIVNTYPAHDSLLSLNSHQPKHHKSQPLLNVRVEQITELDSRLRLSDPSSIEHVALPTEGLNTAAYQDPAETSILDDLHHSLAHQSVVMESLPLEPPNQMMANSRTLGGDERGNTSHSISEFEDHWYEDDEEDADDQAYTTAHSLWSRSDFTTNLIPKFDLQVQRELDAAKIFTAAQKSIDAWDEDMWDVNMVTEYGDEIFDHMRSLEAKLLPDSHYMDYQEEIDWPMRSVLIDWIVQVHLRFRLLPETLFLTVNYIDRFLSRKSIFSNRLQLVGATALLIAAKYEEINCPSLEEIEFMVDKAYAIHDIIKAERFMLSLLCFDLGWPGPMSFLRRVSKADEYDLDSRTMAKYFLEVTLMDELFVACFPSFLASGSHCLARLILRKGVWTMAHVHYSGYTWSQLRPLVSTILRCCRNPREHHSAVFHKYCDVKYKMCAERAFCEIEAGFALPPHPSHTSAPSRLLLENQYRIDEMPNHMHRPMLLNPVEG